jgi:hypothetical protein
MAATDEDSDISQNEERDTLEDTQSASVKLCQQIKPFTFQLISYCLLQMRNTKNQLEILELQ